MSYLWYLLGLIDDYEDQDDLKNKQKHLKYLCCKNIDSGNTPLLRGRLSSFLNEDHKKQRRTKKIVKRH